MLSRSCPKRVVVFFFRRGLPQWASRTIIRFYPFVIVLLFCTLTIIKKFREHRSLAPIPAFSKRLDTRICPNRNHTSEDLSDKYQRCTESEIFDSDSPPASAEYTPTPTHFKVLDSDSFSNSEVNYLNFSQCLNDRIRFSH